MKFIQTGNQNVKNKNYVLIKTVFDILFALILLLPFILIFPVVAFLIKLESPGSVIFKQKRVGKDGKLFWILKFRTMASGTADLSTEEMQNQQFRPITKTGKILRKTNIDEMPQIINILSGEMSFVGPRPALPSQLYVNEKRSQLKIDSLKPGITGLAQVKGRDDLTDAEKISFDYQYWKHFGFFQDLKIMFYETPLAIFSGRGNK
jgi:O-antigen biosynthesis protein WbqP